MSGNSYSVSPRLQALLPVGGLLLLGSFAFWRLNALPPFEDEGFQLHWIRRVFEAGEWTAPLSDGKPLEVWPMVPLIGLGLQPPLLVARALHVLAGAVGAVLNYLLALRLGQDRGTAIASGTLFAMCPFVVYLQRLALSDMFLCVAGLWVLLSVIRLLESPTWLRAGALGVGLVLAVLCKIPVGFWFVTAAPLALLIMPAAERREVSQRPVLTKLVAAHIPAALLASSMVVVALIRWHEGRPFGFGLDEILTIGLGHDIAGTMGVPRPNLVEELTTQLSVPVVLIGLAGVVASAVLDDWRRRWLIAAGVLPMLAIALLPRFWYSRYLLFALPPLIIASVSGWQSLARRYVRSPRSLQIGLLLVCLALMGEQSARLILDPVAARWSPSDRFQYFEGWGSGYGYDRVSQFTLAASDPPAAIYSLDGHTSEQLRNYLPTSWDSRVRLVIYGDDGSMLHTDEARLRSLLSHTPAWIVIAEPLLARYLDSTLGHSNLDRISVVPIAMFEKPGAHVRLGIYRVTSARPSEPRS